MYGSGNVSFLYKASQWEPKAFNKECTGKIFNGSELVQSLPDVRTG
jgi:hypothetical protein